MSDEVYRAEYLNALRPYQQGHRCRHGTRRFGCVLPGNRNDIENAAMLSFRCEYHRTPAPNNDCSQNFMGQSASTIGAAGDGHRVVMSRQPCDLLQFFASLFEP